MTGRSAFASSAAACVDQRAGRPAAGRRRGSRSAGMTASSVGMMPLSTSIGHSRKTGPGRPAVASRKAIAVYSASRFVCTTVRAHLVIGRPGRHGAIPAARHDPLLHRRGAAEDHHGAAARVGVGDAGDAVGHAWPRGQQRDARLAGDARPALGGMDGDLLVAGIHHANALAHAAVVDRGDVAAAEREDDLDALALEHLGHQHSAVSITSCMS